MKVIDAKNAILGRLASYAAKEALKGEEIAILNCEEIIITGNKKDIKEKILQKKELSGSHHRGPRNQRTSEKMVKRVIRGMLPDFRDGRGRDAFKRIKCYVGTPKEFENAEKIIAGKEKHGKINKITEFTKWAKK